MELPFQGDFSDASTTVSNVQPSPSNAYAGNLSAYISPGDQICGQESAASPWPNGANNSCMTVATVANGSPGSLTLTANAPVNCAGCAFDLYPIH